MSEKNEAVTEKDVFLYIRSHPGCKKTDIVTGLRTNGWQVSHKLGKMIRSRVITESGTGKARCYRVAAEFENAEPTFKKTYTRHVSKYKPTIDVYKRMLEGKNLDRLDAPEDAKDLIRLYERHKSLSAWQLFEKFGVSTWLTTELRRLAKAHRKKTLIQSVQR